MKWWRQLNTNSFFIRLCNWEYWPSYAFYMPLLPYYFLQVIRYRHFFFFTAANPGIEAGGAGWESKYETIRKIPAGLSPRSILAEAGSSPESVIEELRTHDMSYPLIVKPDVGFRGFLVKKIDTEALLRSYLTTFPVDFVIQEYIDLQEEVGVFYYRLPGEDKGHITSITQKEFLSVTGDGRASVLNLILSQPRAKLQLKRLKKTHAHLLESVPAEGQKVNLGIIGNHSKGTLFIKGNHLINDSLRRLFDCISKEITGFYYGRFDIKCGSIEELNAGKNFKIIEVNGVCSEPTHIYDPHTSSYFKAVRDIFRHWKILHTISRTNHRVGVKYGSHFKLFRAFWRLNSYMRKLKKIAA